MILAAFQLTAARRRLRSPPLRLPSKSKCFNSQPPEGGCAFSPFSPMESAWFQLTAARRRLLCTIYAIIMTIIVSTHSRPKAAAEHARDVQPRHLVSTHSRPKAAALAIKQSKVSEGVSTHSRPKAAARHILMSHPLHLVSTHSRPKAAALCIKIREKSVNYQ